VSLPPAEVVRYGEHPDQIANLHAPAREGGPWPAIVLVHGGYWRERFDRTTLTPVACDLAARGYLAWNIEYRRVGQEGGDDELPFRERAERTKFDRQRARQALRLLIERLQAGVLHAVLAHHLLHEQL